MNPLPQFKKISILPVVIALALVALASLKVVRADAVTDWNAIASTAIVTNAGQPPPVSALSFAMVQGAVYDAVNAIDRGYQPYLVPSPAMLRTDRPNALTSADCAEDFNEVKELGSLTSTTRTADQTDAAIFWQDHAIALYNRIFRTLAASQGLGIVKSARLFAMENLAAADAQIGCWNDKYYWQFWRPITAIREADTDGNPATEADPSWLPLFDPTTPVCNPLFPLFTPPFPEHPSGHACATSAFVHTLQNCFGTDRIGFSAFSNKSCTTRSFDRFSHALKEVINARVWAGIHFRTADTQGAVLGN